MYVKTYLIASALITLIVLAAACNRKSGTATKESHSTGKDSAALVKRGEYLVTISGCNDCHTPKVMGPHGPELDTNRLLSGFPETRPLPAFDPAIIKNGIVQFNEDLTAAAGPWGVSFAANLTSDASGAGSWSLANFKYALRHGKWKGLEGSRDLLPPMPWFNFAKMTDEDLEAMHSYLKTTQPVSNMVPAPKQFSN